MRNNHTAKDPLLYIQQPSTATPVAPMQHHYYTPKHQQKTNEHISRKSVGSVPLTRNRYSKYQPLIEKDEPEEPTDEYVEDLKFKDMTIKQKVNYFLDRSDHAPIIRSEIRTDEQKYQGVITGYEDGNVLIRIGRRSSSHEVPIDDITNIRIIGF